MLRKLNALHTELPNKTMLHLNINVYILSRKVCNQILVCVVLLSERQHKQVKQKPETETQQAQ